MLDEARTAWESKKASEAGYLIFENLPNEQRPIWGANILELCCEIIPEIPQTKYVIEVAKDPTKWSQGRDAFTIVRKELTSSLNRQVPENRLLVAVYDLAEKVAKITYNATGGPAPYDADSGWLLVYNLRQVVDLVNDPDFEQRAWKILVAPLSK
ncbi:MAG: hypothetical protein DPW16_17800 [Chloroflexi bacterium]|nr:hypothetical protein [Chloroflexota bacterium]